MEKHTPYFELLESLQSTTGCALCDMRKRSTYRHLENVLYENVNDPGLRGRLAESHGFCPRHAEVLLSCGDGLGTAILYQDQVERALQFIQQLQDKNGRAVRKQVQTGWRRHAPCPVCVEEERMDHLRVGVLLDSLFDAEMDQALAASPGLCMPHLINALESANASDARRRLLELHQRKFSQLLDDLKEYIRKHDHRYTDEAYGPEADAWRRAPGMLLGSG